MSFLVKTWLSRTLTKNISVEQLGLYSRGHTSRAKSIWRASRFAFANSSSFFPLHLSSSSLDIASLFRALSLARSIFRRHSTSTFFPRPSSSTSSVAFGLSSKIGNGRSPIEPMKYPTYSPPLSSFLFEIEFESGSGTGTEDLGSALDFLAEKLDLLPWSGNQV